MGNTDSQMRKGFAWSFLENISLQATRFLVGIVMARLLTPFDYGLIGMLTVFIIISDLFVNSGFGMALNQKDNRTDSDFSTTFIFNAAIGILCYVILFLCAPSIAEFYNEPRLISLLRWLAIVIVIKSLSVVPSTILQIELKFKEISIISFASSLVLGISGIILAYMGFEVWALVYSNIIGTLFSMLCYTICARWIPKHSFSKESFKYLFSFGSKALLATFIDVIYNNIYPLIIGRVYAAKELGFYSRAKGYSTLPTGTLSSMIYRVCFPIFCKEKSQLDTLMMSYSKLMRNVAYIIVPIMMVMLILSKQLIVILITDKWLPCVVLLQILCLSSLWLPIMEVNFSIIKALGQPKILLRMQIISKIIAVIVLVITMRYSVEVMCMGAVFVSLSTLIINFILSKDVLNLSLINQIKMILIPVVGGICMLPTLLLIDFIDNIYIQFIFGFLFSLLLYVFSTSLMGIPFMQMLKEIKKTHS